MRNKRFFLRDFIIGTVLIFAFAGNIFPENFAGESAFSYLKISRSAKLAAMGETGVAFMNDSESMYANPANLAFQEDKQAVFQDLMFVESIKIMHASYAQPHEYFSFGIGLGYLDAGSFEKYDADNNHTGSFKASNYDLLCGVGFEMRENVGIGMNLKFVNEKIYNKSASGVSGDLGILVADYENNILFGFSYLNLGPKVKYSSDSFSQPSVLRAGLSLILPENSLFNIEVLNYADTGFEFRSGAEMSFNNFLFFRAGYRKHMDNKPGLKSGFGLSGGLGLVINRVGFDYSFTPYGDFGSAHRISVKYRFGYKEYI